MKWASVVMVLPVLIVLLAGTKAYDGGYRRAITVISKEYKDLS
jgi:hypothetical protein